MEFYRREFFINRLIYGTLRYKLPNGKILYIKQPTPEIKYEAQEIAHESFEEAKASGAFDDEGIKQYLVDLDLWSPKQEDEYINILPKHIEYWKVELYKALGQKDKQKTLRKYLTAAESGLEKLSKIRHSHDNLTCAGIANYNKIYFIIENSTFLKDGTLYNFEDISIAELLNFYSNAILSEREIRELARTEPWYSTWSTSQKLGVSPFKCDITEEHKRLIMWASLYDNIQESPECPSQEVINDDDMLDGWMIVQRREREQAKFKRDSENKFGNKKISNADEVFIVKDYYNAPEQKPEDFVKEVDSLNDGVSALIKKQRVAQMHRAGTIKEQDFVDVKRDMQAKLVQQLKEQRNGRR